VTGSPPAVAYLGPPGTFTHQAALALRPDLDASGAVPVDTQAGALDAVARGEVTHAVLPIDNSVNGVVVPTLDALLAHPGLAVVDSVLLPISFDALTPDAGVAPTVVVSHPHALAQCRGYAASLGVPTREAASTAAACRSLAPGEVGLGPAVCGSLYGLATLATAVEDHATAYTQFALVGAEPSAGSEPARTAAGGEGVLVSLLPDVNVPGLLRRLLDVLEERGVNMANVVTRPVPDRPGIYVFCLHLAGDVPAGELARMRATWADQGARARTLGRISPLAELVRRGAAGPDRADSADGADGARGAEGAEA